MPICKKCKKTFPNRKVIEGRERSLNKRKLCLTCSPFGLHNTRPDPAAQLKRPKTYADYPPELRRYHSRSLLARAHERRNCLIERAGGACSVCGYKRCSRALTFHHLNAESKSFSLSASALRSHSWEDVQKEAKKCVLLCANCHHEAEHRKAVERMGVDLCIGPGREPKTARVRRELRDRKRLDAVRCLCGAQVSRGSQRCRPCSRVASRKVVRPSRRTLFVDVETLSMEAVGKKYGVSSNAVRKWLRKYDR